MEGLNNPVSIRSGVRTPEKLYHTTHQWRLIKRVSIRSGVRTPEKFRLHWQEKMLLNCFNPLRRSYAGEIHNQPPLRLH